nr:Concanavalin A lectin glucanase [Hymenolepis microstoma]
MSGAPTSFLRRSFPYALLLLLCTITRCLSSPGLFNFTGPNAFIEIDTQPLSCSIENQINFSLKFDVFPLSNSSVLFTGISGSLLPSNWSEDLAPDGVNFLGAQGDPLALFIYIERPYFSFMLMRLTDYQVRFYLHHTFGYFDRSWNDWHRVEIVLSKHGKSRVKATFKVDQKSNNGFLTLGNIIWPDWSKLKSFAPREIGSKRRFYFNEAFIGLPSQETMSHYAIDILVKYMDPIRTVYARTDVYESSFEKFVPFRGLIKSFLLSSDCACGILTYFGPKMIQVGPGVEITSVCDISSLPPLFSKLPGSCRSKVPGISCGCLSYTGDPICYCPLEQNCTTMKKQDAVLMRLGLLKTEIIDENVDTENYLVLTNGFPPSPSFLNEDPVTYSKLDSCFANIFLCEKPIIYEFWMHIDPLALINGSTLVMKHASYINSPWYMKIAYNGYSTRLSNSEHVMELSAEIQAPPNHIWRIERCDSNLRAVPGQWHQVKIHWDKVTLSLYLDGNLCGTAESMTSIIHGNIKQRFANRRTPFLFFGNHTIEDLIFNDKEIIPKFTHLNALSNNFDKLEPIISKITGDFYASFQLNASLEFLFIQLPGMHITKCGDDGKIAVEDKQSKECRVFQLPERCEDRDACSVEVERQGSEITAYSQDEKLSPVFEMRLCEIAKECRMREQVNQTLGLVPNTQIQLFNRGRTELEIRRHIHISKLQALNCGFNYIHSASKHSPMDLIGVCEPSLTYSRVLVKAIDSLPKSSIKGALMVSENSLLLQSKATSPEALCLRDLELCRNGMTISFWILALPTTKSSKSWPILQQTSLSGSELTVDLFRNDGQYFLDVSVKSLHTIVDGKAISALWNVNPHIENLDENWTLVTISWSHAVGLSAQFNGTIVASDRQSTETISLWEAPIHKGVWFGHQGNPDTSDGVVIDDFQFIPAEINYLDHVGQEIDVTLSNKNLNLCRLDTCWDGSSCYPISRKVDSLGPFCQCDRPRRVCRELPVGVAVYTSTFSSTTTTQAPTTISLMTTATTPLVISGQSLLSRTAIASTAQPLNSSTTPKTTTSMSLINEILQSTSDQSSPLQGRFKEAGDLSRDFEASVSHNFDKHFLLKCDPQCQNGGKCVEFNGHFSCDCSETPFWGKVCVREHVGWLSQKERVFKNEPRHRTFAAYNAVHGGSKMRLIFKTPITAVMPEKRVKKSIAAIQRSEYMVLLAVQTELGTLGLVTINSGLYILIKGVKKSMTQLLPCPQSHELITDDTLTHVIQLEHRGTLLRVKVDGVSVYPTEVIPNSCDKWLFFSPFHHINNRTYEETAIPQSNGFSPNSGKAVLGAWPDGEGEFKGAIGGWMIDGEEMFTPVSDEPEDTPNTVYRLSTRFYLTNRDFYWIRLHSLTPVTVLSDYPPVKTSPTLTVTLWFWIVGCISMGLLLLFICCWACLRVCRQQKDKRKTTWRRNYSPLKPMVAKSPSESSHIMSDTVQYYPTLVNGNGLTPKPRRLRARSLTCKVRSTVTTDNHWRARMLTLQSYQPVRRVSAFDYASMKKASMGSIYSHEERDDIEKILVTSEGDSVITLSTNHGISVKQWSAYDSYDCFLPRTDTAWLP